MNELISAEIVTIYFSLQGGGFPILAAHESTAFSYLQLLIYLSRAITQDGH